MRDWDTRPHRCSGILSANRCFPESRSQPLLAAVPVPGKWQCARNRELDGEVQGELAEPPSSLPGPHCLGTGTLQIETPPAVC